MHNKRDYVEKIIEGLLFVFGIVALLVANISVLTRFLKIPFSWSDELLRALFVTMFFVGSAIELKTNGLISITVLEEALKKKKMPYLAVKSFQYIVCAGFSFFCAYQGVQVAVSNFKLDKRTAVMNMPSGYILIAFAMGMILMGAYSIYTLARICKEK